MKDLNQIILNPVRMRIIQYLISNEIVTAKELVEWLPDVPRTTLYRHINTLAEANILKVVKENRIRGTVEKVYSLNTDTIASQNTIENASLNAFGFLMNIYADFDRYFKGDDVDPNRDKLFFNHMVLMLSDNEFDDFIGEFRGLVEKHLNNESSTDRKPRRLSIISSPNIDK